MGLFLLSGLPLLAATAVFLLPQDRQRKAVLFATSGIHLAATIGLWQGPLDVRFNAFLGVDALSRLVLTLISTLFFVVAIYLMGYLKERRRRSNRIMAGCLLCLLSAMTVVAMSRHMGLLWIAVETVTLLSAPTINYHRTPQSIEATWKYLLISSLGIALGLLGTLFLAISAASVVKTVFLADILNNAAALSPSWLKLSAIFLVVGYGTKMGLAPMHTWKPDTYGEAPAPIGALMSGALTACAFLAVSRVAQICLHAGLREFVAPVFILLGVLSLGIAAIFIMGQKDFNRMLGYSSIEHMGIITLGIGLGGGAIWASLFHAINNAFAKGLMFLAAGNLQQGFRSKKVANIQGVIHRFPATGTFLLLGLAVVAGFPPFGIFYSELLILKEAIMTRHYAVVFLYFLFLSVIFFGFARVILGMAMGLPAGQAGKVPESEGGPHETKKETFFMVVPLAVLGIVLFFCGVFVPDSIYTLIDQASALLGQGR